MQIFRPYDNHMGKCINDVYSGVSIPE